MLIRFAVSNFLSFDDEVDFNMLTSNWVSEHKHHVTRLHSKVKVVRGAAIYGPNGAGKSNFVKAVEFFRNLVLDGELQNSVEHKKFKLNPESSEKPLTFEVEFAYEKKLYAYGVQLQGVTVEKEWFYEIQPSGKQDKKIFERKHKKGKIEIDVKNESLDKERSMMIDVLTTEFLKKHQLLISKPSILKKIIGKEVDVIYDWFKNRLFILYPNMKLASMAWLLSESKQFKKLANTFIQKLDTGVQGIDIEKFEFDIFFGEDDEKTKQEIASKIEKEGVEQYVSTEVGTVLVKKENGNLVVFKPVTWHENKNGERVKFNLPEESDGTQRLLDIFPIFDLIHEHSSTFVIDEIDQSLHPALLKKLIEKIMENKDLKGQMIFTTHESNILDQKILRKDEIWFAEKNRKTSATVFYPLSDFKTRLDLNLELGYLKGRFGAVPLLHNLEEIKWEQNEKKPKV